jgi:hypothetical protein
MKYLYIPTTTLNFNNILSTDSISPATVYAARRFGYNKFEAVPPNPFQSILLLYSRYPVFSVMDADRDNFPLVIRIRADRLFDVNHANRDINIYDKTIYFDPASTEFLFASPEAKKITLIKAEPSLTTKLVALYQPRMQVVSSEQIDSFIWSLEMLDNISDGSSEVALRNCEPDMRINRLKGFVCGYMLGAYKTLDEKAARFRSVMKEQRNEISAMLNDPSRGNQERLRRALESCTTLDELWSKEGAGRRRFEPEQGDRIVNDRGQISALEYRHESDSQSSLLLIKLFNTYCLTSDFAGQLDESRFNVAMDGAKAIKNLMGNDWENSPTQAYINDLLNNIKSGSPFDFNSSNSLALKSFAAFVQKGDDLEKLETFLIDQGIGDFRIAFALWGAMFGFSKIPKTVYNMPELRGDSSYMKKMHNYIHSVVHGISLRELEEVVQITPPLPITTKTQAIELSQELVDTFQEQLPGAAHWLPSISRLWEECGNVYKDFIARLDKEKSSSLGGRLKKGTQKGDVIDFFKGNFQTQTELSEQPSLLANEHKTLKFWDDPDAWKILPSRYQQTVQKELKWFQNEWKNPDSTYYGRQSKSRIKDKPFEQRTNADAITYFTRLMTKQLGESASDEIRRLLINSYR